MSNPVYFGLEAGGTKCVCIAAEGPGRVLAERVIPTTSPAETLARAAAFFQELGVTPAACGVASFGPIDSDRNSPGFGTVATTPKPGWTGARMLSVFQNHACPKGFDTDVVGAGLAEQLWGAGRGERHLAYLTIGTGIGAGVLDHGRTVAGAAGLELGHLRPRRAEGDAFAGCCPFHGDCFEGLASGPAIQARSGASLSEMRPDDPAHALEAEYLAQLCAALVFAHAPGRIILGGGVMKTPGLLAQVRARLGPLLGGYCRYRQTNDLDRFVQAPGLGDQAGALGAVALAMAAAGALA